MLGRVYKYLLFLVLILIWKSQLPDFHKYVGQWLSICSCLFGKRGDVLMRIFI
jgi:hypothetical protein